METTPHPSTKISNGKKCDSTQFKQQEKLKKNIHKHKNFILHSTQTKSHPPFLKSRPPYYFARAKINCPNTYNLVRRWWIRACRQWRIRAWRRWGFVQKFEGDSKRRDLERKRELRRYERQMPVRRRERETERDRLMTVAERLCCSCDGGVGDRTIFGFLWFGNWGWESKEENAELRDLCFAREERGSGNDKQVKYMNESNLSNEHI